jgi:uronate dehydrogenase
MTEDKGRRIVFTGAAGGIGTMTRPLLAKLYPGLVLSDRVEPKDLQPGETFVKADLTKPDEVAAAVKGAHSVIHLGGHSVEGTWDQILNANIIGCYNIFEAARLNGVKRILFPTSNHAVGFYRRDKTIDHHIYPRPDSRYGVSKVFGEALGSLYADKYGMQVFCMRIGNVNPVPIDTRRLSILFTPRDLAQLVTIGIEHPDIRFEIVYGISKNTRAWYDNSNAYRLGYKPQDDSEQWAAEVLANEKAGDPTAELYQGGMFCVAEDIPNPAPLPERKKRK